MLISKFYQDLYLSFYYDRDVLGLPHGSGDPELVSVILIWSWCFRGDLTLTNKYLTRTILQKLNLY